MATGTKTIITVERPDGTIEQVTRAMAIDVATRAHMEEATAAAGKGKILSFEEVSYTYKADGKTYQQALRQAIGEDTYANTLTDRRGHYEAR